MLTNEHAALSYIVCFFLHFLPFVSSNLDEPSLRRTIGDANCLAITNTVWEQKTTLMVLMLLVVAAALVVAALQA